MCRPQHRLRDETRVHSLDDSVKGSPDAVRGIRRGGSLGGCDDGAVLIHHDGVSVRPTDVDTNAQLSHFDDPFDDPELRDFMGTYSTS